MARPLGSYTQGTMKEFIEARIERIPFSGCWIWMQSLAKSGYGNFRRERRSGTQLTHRASYTAFVGPVPEGLHVLHRCDVRACCNPSHLFVGTNQDNIADSVAKGRRIGVTRNRPSGLKYRPLSNAAKEAHMKFPRDLRLRIKERSANGESKASLAREYKTSWNTIMRAIRWVS